MPKKVNQSEEIILQIPLKKKPWYKEIHFPKIPWKRVPPTVLGVKKRNLKSFVTKYESDMQLALLPLILIVVLFTVNAINNHKEKELMAEELPFTRVDTLLNPYPFISTENLPQITAKAAIIVDRNSQVILFAKNANLRFSMASTTKIMTALVSLDYYAQNSVLTIKRNEVEGSGLHLAKGEQYLYRDLLYAMLLPSANDAAQAIADNYPGGAEAFVAKMNEKARVLHLDNTHFADPTGLDDDGDFTTVVDMARLATHAVSNPEFVEVTSTKLKSITSTNGQRQFDLMNLNKLLGTEGVTGIKTGTTEGAGEVLVTSTIKNGHMYIIVVMQSTNRFYDTAALMQFIENNVSYIVPKDTLQKE